MSGIHHFPGHDDHTDHHHHSDHHHHGHDHHHAGHDHRHLGHERGGRAGRIFLPRPRVTSRRAFLGNFGKGTVALAVFTPILAACSSDGTDSAAVDTGQEDTDAGSDTTTAEDGATTTQGQDQDQTDDSGEPLQWARANLGFVSAYVLARGTKAAIVDTGTSGSAAQIGETLGTLGLTYRDVEHVILTHHHGDHIGSIDEVMTEASSATVYAGEADLANIPVDGIVPLVGGEDVFGLETVPTPGHTPGHMAVIDRTTGLLVAGDAIFTEGGGVVEGPARFFNDVPQSRDTIRDLAELSFNTLLVGHGEPIEGNADTAVADLAASL